MHRIIKCMNFEKRKDAIKKLIKGCTHLSQLTKFSYLHCYGNICEKLINSYYISPKKTNNKQKR